MLITLKIAYKDLIKKWRWAARTGYDNFNEWPGYAAWLSKYSWDGLCRLQDFNCQACPMLRNYISCRSGYVQKDLYDKWFEAKEAVQRKKIARSIIKKLLKVYKAL